MKLQNTTKSKAVHTSAVTTALEIARLAVKQRTCALHDEISIHFYHHCDVQVWMDGDEPNTSVVKPAMPLEEWETATPEGCEEGVIQTCIVHAQGSWVMYGPSVTSYLGGTYSVKVCLYRKLRSGRYNSSPWNLLYVAICLPSHGQSDRPTADIYFGAAFKDSSMMDRVTDPRNYYALGNFADTHFTPMRQSVYGPESIESLPFLRFLAITNGEKWTLDPEPKPEPAATIAVSEKEKPTHRFKLIDEINHLIWRIFHGVPKE